MSAEKLPLKCLHCFHFQDQHNENACSECEDCPGFELFIETRIRELMSVTVNKEFFEKVLSDDHFRKLAG